MHVAIAEAAHDLSAHRGARIDEVKWLLRRIESERKVQEAFNNGVGFTVGRAARPQRPALVMIPRSAG